MTNRLDHDSALDLLQQWEDETAPKVNRAIKQHAARHLPADAEWLADLLHAKAKRGDPHARRMYGKLLLRLTSYGAACLAPSWPPLTSPKRRAELDAILAEQPEEDE